MCRKAELTETTTTVNPYPPGSTLMATNTECDNNNAATTRDNNDATTSRQHTTQTATAENARSPGQQA